MDRREVRGLGDDGQARKYGRSSRHYCVEFQTEEHIFFQKSGRKAFFFEYA